jgi:hypothetical protein
MLARSLWPKISPKETNNMTTKTRNSNKVETWLPIFSGFYGTIWDGEHDAEFALEDINQKREENGLAPLSDDVEIEWDYEGYYNAVAEGIAESVGDALVEGGYIKGYEFQKLNSPREYNFANDSIHVAFTLDTKHKATITNYLKAHKDAFSTYLQRYQSGPGFISHHSPDVDMWMIDLDEVLAHQHKLGAVLDFILRNENAEMEGDIYEDLSGNGVVLEASNYVALTGGK